MVGRSVGRDEPPLPQGLPASILYFLSVYAKIAAILATHDQLFWPRLYMFCP